MDELKISLIQTELYWENPEANRKQFEEKIDLIETETDLILLPEMFTTGFSMNSVHLAEKMGGESLKWMKKLAHQRKTVICGSLIIEEKGNYYNRLIWMQADGKFEYYDKRHLFRMAQENRYFSPGKERLITQIKGWKICPQICYDLRFPVWSRNQFKTDRNTYAHPEYDLLIYIANWPEARVDAWKKLLHARAIENQAYVVGLNRIGRDGKDVAYNGGSIVIDAKGMNLWEAEDNQEELINIKLNMDQLESFRKKFPVGMDGDEFELNIKH